MSAFNLVLIQGPANKSVVGKLVESEDPKEEQKIIDMLEINAMYVPDGKGSIVQIFISNTVGDAISISDAWNVTKLDEKSAYFVEYVRVMTNIQIVPPGHKGPIREV